MVPRPDIWARLTRLASRANSLQGSHVYRINDLAKTVKVWHEAAILQYKSTPLWEIYAWGADDGVMRKRGEKIPGGSMAPVVWSDAAYGDHSTVGERRLGHVIRLMPSALRGPCHIIQRAANFARDPFKISLGGEVYEFSRMVDHMLMLRGIYAHPPDLFLGYGWPQSLRMPFFAPEEQDDYHREFHGSTVSGYAAGLGDAGAGQCILASGTWDSGGRIDESQERHGASS